ncbi:hypothetical protein [Paractinoplanes maris]|uniref:hypothetical protein n=1 Tax=Paractinoplanes maris TaxID=1734446 RepID=UPI0020210191|nr:hypothetical protein [Actinoplanes maris]
MTTAPHVPAPPPGPGVQPPFPAPPVEGKGKRLGLSLGIGAGVVVLICSGGVAALIGLGSSVQGALNEQAESAVDDYLTALKARLYDDAYGQLCGRAKRDETAAEFRTRVEGEQRITAWRTGTFNSMTGTVPLDATYEDGQTEQLEASLDQNTSTGAFEVCELGE